LKLPLGKVPHDILQKHILHFQGQLSDDVIVGPGVGLDFAVIDLDFKYLIVSSDPVTGVKEDIGWYAVNVSANDVATSGAIPKFLTSVILLPKNSDISIAKNVAEQIDIAAKKLNISVIGGHTEISPNLSQIIVSTTAFGITDKYVTASNIKKNDIILMTKTAGIEGTSILARNLKNKLKKVNQKTLQKASEMINQISIVKDAAILFKTGKVHAMHDSTEGGLIGGIYEMAVASNIGFKLIENKIGVANETKIICNTLKIDPLKLIGSGCLLAAVKPSSVEKVIEELEKNGVKCTEIGTFGGKKREIVKADGNIEEIQHEVTDEIWNHVEH